MIGIYKITNRINNKAYIGQSIHIENRWREHLNNIHSNRENAIYQAMRKYGAENFSFEVLETCAEQDLDEREKFWILYYNTYENGYNMTLGGSDGRQFDYAYLVSQYKIYKTVKETAKHCGCHEHTVSKALKSYNIQPNTKATGVGRPVKQIDPQTLQVVATYNSIADAAKAMNVNSNAAISRALAGKTKTAYGYIWKDLHDNNIQAVSPKNMHKNQILQQLDKNTQEVIAEYDSVKDALIALGRNPKDSGIYSVCKGKANTAYGYKWRFAGKE